MRLSRYLDARAFLEEARKLKVWPGYLEPGVLERLEEQRSLIPRLRLRYPDPIERRWWAECHDDHAVGGELEPDGPRWAAACDLERQRQHDRFCVDPTSNGHVLDAPQAEHLEFIEQPTERPFVPWSSYRVSLHAPDAEPFHTSETEVTYYSAWQLLQFAEVATMGVISFMNLLEAKDRPNDEAILAAPRFMSFMPIHALRGFKKHEVALNAIIWFAEEESIGYQYATRNAHHRRMMTGDEIAEVSRTRLWAAEQAQVRHRVGHEELLAAVRFLCEQWAEWHHEGRPLIADAYKLVAALGVRLGCLVSGKTTDEYRTVVGRAGGYFKPIMDVIWPDWAAEQRDNARRVLVNYRHPSALLRADFSDDLVNQFLAFIEDNHLHGFYWRLESFRRHSFKGNNYSLEGLKGDVQGMAVVLEHIATALGAKKEQLRDKFKELWVSDAATMKLLKSNEVMKVGNGKVIDLDWFEQRNALSLPEQTAADLAIAYAIRGGAHRVISETDPLKLERMMLIMLRAVVKTFRTAAATKQVQSADPIDGTQ